MAPSAISRIADVAREVFNGCKGRIPDAEGSCGECLFRVDTGLKATYDPIDRFRAAQALIKARIVSSPQTATNRRVENVEPSFAVNQSWTEAFSDLSGVVKNEMVSGDPRILEILWPATHTEPLQSSLP